MPCKAIHCTCRNDASRRTKRRILNMQERILLPGQTNPLRWYARVMPWGIALAEDWQICQHCQDARPWCLKWTDIDDRGIRSALTWALPYGNMPERDFAALADALQSLADTRQQKRPSRKPSVDRSQSLFDDQPTAPQPITANSEEIERIRVCDVLTCDGCGDTIFPCDPAYAHATLFVVGCSRRCCADAAITKTAALAWEGEKVAA